MCCQDPFVFVFFAIWIPVKFKIRLVVLDDKYLTVNMKDGIFGIKLVKAFRFGYNRSSFREKEIEGKKYFEAIPGEEFEVHVTVDFSSISEDYSCYTLRLCIDERIHAYIKGDIRHQKQPFKFLGHWRDNEQFAFAFAKTDLSVSSSIETTPIPIESIGRIKISLYESEKIVRPRKPEVVTPQISNYESISVGENKFWKLPSVSTVLGRSIEVVERPTKVSATEKVYQYKKLLGSVQVSYHTASTLKLLHNEAIRAARRLSTSTENEVNEDYEEDSDAAADDDVEIVERAPREIPRFDLIKEEEEEQQQNSRKPKKARKQVIIDLTGDDDTAKPVVVDNSLVVV